MSAPVPSVLSSAQAAGRPIPDGLELVVLVALVMSLNALAIDGMLPALDNMARELGAREGNQRQLIIGVYLLANGVGCLIPGSLADRFGRRPVLLCSLMAYVLFALIMAVLKDFTWMLVARALQGAFAAGLQVVPMAIIRDRYEGDRMARMMSLVGMVFITVPIIAPTLGQAVLLFAGWRWIFAGLTMMAAIAAAWIWFRLPETLDPRYRQNINMPVIARNMGTALINRASAGYVIGGALLMGGVFGYVNSAQQLLGEHFGVGEWFPLVFGATAAMMVLSNLVNARIVERFGARRVSHTGVIVFIVVSAVQVWAAHYRPDSLQWFMPLMATNLALLGFLGANFGSIAMQPFASIAGAASSIQTFIRMFGAAVIGMVIGQAYDDSARPFAHALLICSTAALLLVLYSEKGQLFRRLHPPRPKG